MKRALLISMLDQAVLSAQSLAVGFVLIWLGDVEAVGRFALATSLFFAFLTVQDSLAGAVLANRVYGRGAARQRETIGHVTAMAFCLLLLAVAVTAAVSPWLNFGFAIATATVAMIAAGLLRELARGISIAVADMGGCLRMSAVAAGSSLVLLPLLWMLMPPELACLWAIALGHGAAALIFGPRLLLSVSGVRTVVSDWRQYLGMSGWSLVIGLSAELRSRTFLFIVEALRGLAATSAIHVGRMLTSPMGLVAMAMGRVILPRMAHCAHRGDQDAVFAIFRQSAALLTLLGAVYALALYAGWPLLDAYLLKGRYPAVSDALPAWCVLTVVAAPSWCMHWLFRALERFRELALISLADTVAVLAAMGCLMLDVPLETSIVILIVGELAFTAALLWLLRGWRAPAREAA